MAFMSLSGQVAVYSGERPLKPNDCRPVRAAGLGDYIRSGGPRLLQEEPGKSTGTCDARGDGEVRRVAIDF